MKERVKWIDVAKFLGIFAIYLGHCGKDAGYAYKFVFAYHVPFFFFLSGCMSNYNNENNFGEFVWSKIKRIMVPFWGFSILSIFLEVVMDNKTLIDIENMLVLVLKGNVRNTFFAVSLWFLSCLFIIELIFKLLKYLKVKTVILAICIIAYYIAATMISPSPIVEPHWLYNVDSAMYFIIYYAIGYIVYPYVLKLFYLNTKTKKVVFLLSGFIALVYSAFAFEQYDYLTIWFKNVPYINLFIPVAKAMLIIWLNLTLARLLQEIKLFADIGKETLYLCGNEYIIKQLFPNILAVFGLGINMQNPLIAYIYIFVLVILGTKFLIPCEKMFINKVKKSLDINDNL